MKRIQVRREKHAKPQIREECLCSQGRARSPSKSLRGDSGILFVTVRSSFDGFMKDLHVRREMGICFLPWVWRSSL